MGYLALFVAAKGKDCAKGYVLCGVRRTTANTPLYHLPEKKQVINCPPVTLIIIFYIPDTQQNKTNYYLFRPLIVHPCNTRVIIICNVAIWLQVFSCWC